jgi:hypothetical protein
VQNKYKINNNYSSSDRKDGQSALDIININKTLLTHTKNYLIQIDREDIFKELKEIDSDKFNQTIKYDIDFKVNNFRVKYNEIILLRSILIQYKDVEVRIEKYKIWRDRFVFENIYIIYYKNILINVYKI